MTQQVEITAVDWTLISTGKTRGLIENTTGLNLKVRIETVGTVPAAAEKWGHNLLINKFFTWEKSAAGADIYVRSEKGGGLLLVSEGQ